MYVCMHVCMYVCMYVCTITYVSVVCVCLYACVYIYIYVHKKKDMYVCVYADLSGIKLYFDAKAAGRNIPCRNHTLKLACVLKDHDERSRPRKRVIAA